MRGRAKLDYDDVSSSHHPHFAYPAAIAARAGAGRFGPLRICQRGHSGKPSDAFARESIHCKAERSRATTRFDRGLQSDGRTRSQAGSGMDPTRRRMARKIIHPRRGEVWLVNFDPTVGAEIQKTRPALVIQNDIGNRLSPITIVAAITFLSYRIRIISSSSAFRLVLNGARVTHPPRAWIAS
jgi:hypothetical protein